MNDWVDRFLEHLAVERRVSENTISAYRNDLRQFSRYLVSSRAARLNGESPVVHAPGRGLEVDAANGRPHIGQDSILDFLLSLKEDRGYAQATVARKIAAVKALCHYLHKMGVLDADPTADVGSPAVKKVLPRPVGPKEIIALLDQAAKRPSPDSVRDHAMLRLLYSTGMRVSELVSLDIDDLVVDSGVVRCIGRAGRMRTIPIDRGTQLELRAYLRKARAALAPDERALFMNHRGQRLTRQGFWLIMKTIARAAGISGPVTPHMLRHSFAAHRLQDGVALKQLKELLGHANIATTQMYAQLPHPAHPESL